MDENKATSLDEFEKQLKQNVDGGASSLADFEQQLKSNVGVTQTPAPQQQGQKQTVKVKKNIVLSFPLKLVA